MSKSPKGHHLDKTLDSEIYAPFSFEMKTQLDVDDARCYVESKNWVPEDAVSENMTMCILVLSLDKSLYVYVKNSKSTEEVLTTLKDLCHDSWMDWMDCRIGLKQKLCSKQFNDCSSVEENLSQVILTAQKFNDIGFVINDVWISCLLLAYFKCCGLRHFAKQCLTKMKQKEKVSSVIYRVYGKNKEWVVDNARDHMVFSKGILRNLNTSNGKVNICYGKVFKVGEGDTALYVKGPDGDIKIDIKYVLLVPKLKGNLSLIKRLIAKKLKTYFDMSVFKVKNSSMNNGFNFNQQGIKNLKKVSRGKYSNLKVGANPCHNLCNLTMNPKAFATGNNIFKKEIRSNIAFDGVKFKTNKNSFLMLRADNKWYKYKWKEKESEKKKQAYVEVLVCSQTY